MILINRRAVLSLSVYDSLFIRSKHDIDYSKVPILHENDLEEMHVRGSGPGGTKASKTSNCVVLKHIPTGIVVKCHETRYLEQNQKRARSHLITRLDNLINGECSVEAQLKLLKERKSLLSDKKKEKLKALREDWKKRENLT